MAIPVAALAALAQTGYQLYKGQQQKKAAKNIKVGERGLSEYTRKADREAQIAAAETGYAGQDQARQLQEANVANILEQSKADPRSYNTSLANAMSSMSNYNLQDAAKEESVRSKFRQAAISSSRAIGSKEEEIQEKNIAAAAGRKQALSEAGERNVYSGVTGALGAVAKASELGEGEVDESEKSKKDKSFK